MAGAGLATLGNVARAVSQWSLIVLTAQVLGPTEVGRITVVLAIVTPIILAAELSLRNVYITLRTPAPFVSYLVVRATALGLALCVVGVIAVVVDLDGEILLLIVAIRLMDSISDLYCAPLQAAGRFGLIALVNVGNAVFTILGFAVALGVLGSLNAALVVSLCISIITLTAQVIHALSGRRTPSEATSHPNVRAIIGAGVPSGIAFAASSAALALPIYFLELRGATQVDIGTFGVLAYFPTLGLLLLSSIQQVLLPLYRHRSETSRRGYVALHRRITVVFAVAGLAAGATFLLIGSPLVEVLYGDRFIVSFDQVAVIGACIGVLPLTFVFSLHLLTENRYGSQLIVNLSALLLTTASAFALIAVPGDDIVWAAIVLLIALVSRSGISAVLAGRSGRRRMDRTSAVALEDAQ